MTISVKVSDYTLEPLGRYHEDGPGNGEDFRKDYLVPHLRNGARIDVYLDGINDEYGSSFIVEAFANLIRCEKFEPLFVFQHLNLISEHNDWKEEIKFYMHEAEREYNSKRGTNV